MAKVYFSGSISGGREYQGTYIRIVQWLKRRGHQVLSEHVADPGVLDLERKMQPKDIYLRDVALVESCDVMIAEVTNPSLGVGYEVCLALQLGKPVLCVYRDGTFVSRMITGNTSPNIRVKGYESHDELFGHIASFLDESDISK